MIHNFLWEKNKKNMKLIGKGNTAEVYDAVEEKILKLFVKGYPKFAVEHEYKNARIMQSFHLPVPACFEMTEVDNRYGIVYEKVSGCDLYEYMIKNNAGKKGIEIFYNLQNQILNCKCNELMSYKDFIKMIIGDKSPETIKKLDKLPDGENICHGDFHLWNILIDDSGKAKVIDFMNVCRGPKLYDIARTFYLLKGDGSSDEGKSEEEMAIIRQREKLLDKYLVLHGVKKEELQPYLEVIEVCHKCEML